MERWTQFRQSQDQRWYELACGHRQYALRMQSWNPTICMTCGLERRVVAQQGPADLEKMFRLG